MTAPDSLAAIAARLAGYDPKALRVEVAQDFIGQLLSTPAEQSEVPLRQALGRVLSADVVSPLNVPAFDNSAMDGFALRGSDLQSDGPTRLRVAGTSLAGQAGASALRPGCCQRIMTGAVMPPGLDTVVPQELVQLEADAQGEHISIPPGMLQPGDNRRLAGEDLAHGAIALRQGRKLRAADIGLLASLGLAQVPVWRRLRVAILSTGNELVEQGQVLPLGGLYDSNRHTLWALLEQLGVEVIDLGLVRDDPQALRAAFSRAALEADAVISSGGVSVGEADHTKAVMAELGDVLFWRVAMRPGRPLAIGRMPSANGPGTLLFGLPGNPVAVMVTFYAFVREALLRMSGATPEPLLSVQAISTEAMRKKPGRTEYQRGIVSRNAAGQWQVAITGNQGSGILSSMCQANALVVLSHEQADVRAGDWVTVWPLAALS
ncbi:molybdopterin molybdotransferase MoeA [Roseateles sp. PN1]|uniref:molybdopterin molybdotransferase MoeA n=1 Tax=Roseateles sp. PN1 TaxID=3137372 RepID=UPI003138FDD9